MVNYKTYRKDHEDIPWDQVSMIVDGVRLIYPCDIKAFTDTTMEASKSKDPIRCQLSLESDGNTVKSPINGNIVAIGSYSNHGKELYTLYTIESNDGMEIELGVENYVQGAQIKHLGDAVAVGETIFKADTEPWERLKITMTLFDSSYKRVETYSQVH